MSRQGIRATALKNCKFTTGSKSARKGTAMELIKDFVQSEGEASFEEIVEMFMDEYVPKSSGKDVTESTAKGYARGAYAEGYLDMVGEDSDTGNDEDFDFEDGDEDW